MDRLLGFFLGYRLANSNNPKTRKKARIIALITWSFIAVLFIFVGYINLPTEPINIANETSSSLSKDHKWYILNKDDYTILGSYFAKGTIKTGSSIFSDAEDTYYYNLKVHNNNEDFIISVMVYGDKAKKLSFGENVDLEALASEIPDKFKEKRQKSLDALYTETILDFCMNDNYDTAPSGYMTSIFCLCISILSGIAFIVVLKKYSVDVPSQKESK